ncbi:MAG TPA: hypothetical protein ENK38_05185 [Gammaproteobacteria bacterium]|nr:hypothetical protein [Gammaproteobacteria bacterium]
MKQSTIDTMLELIEGIKVLTGTDIESSRLDAAIEDLKAEKKEEVWIPPKGFIFNDADGLPRRSKGRLTGDGRLIYEGGIGNFCTRRWTRIPNLSQWLKHDGSDKCPCEDKAVYILVDGKIARYDNDILNLGWGVIKAWHYAEDLVIE